MFALLSGVGGPQIFKGDVLQRNDRGIDDTDILRSIDDERVIDYPSCPFGYHRGSPDRMEDNGDILFNIPVVSPSDRKIP